MTSHFTNLTGNLPQTTHGNKRERAGFKYNSTCCMQSRRCLLIALFLLTSFGYAQDVGSGAPSGAISSAFLFAYYRNGFYTLVSLPPINNVTKLGTNGYVQEFYDSTKTTGVKYALILGNLTGSVAEGQNAVFQAFPAVYSYYTQVGVTAAGYPTTDTQPCPIFPGNSCQFQLFDKNYALFAYSAPVNGGTASNFYIRDPFYTLWQSFGGIYALGTPTTAETAFTSAAGNVATVQTYSIGMIANITSGSVSARTVGVKEPVWDVYVANGGYTGTMGLPIGAELKQPNGHYRQAFEGGTIDYDPNTPGSAVLLAPVKAVVLSPTPQGGTLQLTAGSTATLTATAFDAYGNPLTGRAFNWNTTNGRIASITANGGTATVKALSGGAATITVTAEGVSSANYHIFVIAPCCAVGEGAPTTALQQSFQDAIARNKLSPKLPAASPVTQVGGGYVQQFQSTDSGETFWIAAAQTTGSAFYVHSPVLDEYQNEGGPAGPLGYPVTDPTAGGRQNFERGSLAGNPVLPVTGAILSKWALLGYETGVAGNPAALPTSFLTFRATSGISQKFQNAQLFAITSGAQAGKVYSVSGLMLTAFSGASSDLGTPVNDEIGLNGLRHQDFEGGYVEYAPGDTAAKIVLSPRTPTVTATPPSLPAGGVVRLTAGGFSANAQLRVSVTGQADFVTTVPDGAYVWERYIPANNATSTVTVKAVDIQTQSTAQTTFTIRGGGDARLSLKAVNGDAQVGLPGATLPVKVQVRYADDSGNPVPNATVRFNPSPGGEVSAATVLSDADGNAAVSWRLPPSDGIALLAVTAGGHVLNVSAKASHSSLVNFPALSQTNITTPLGNGTDPIATKGALLVSAAAVLRYYQVRGALPTPLGLADPASLNTYLKTACVADATGGNRCDGFLQPAGTSDQIVNLWRLGGFVGGALQVTSLPVNLRPVLDALAQGVPVILALTLSNGAAHFVVATGVDANGTPAIMDPAYGKTSLAYYTVGFNAPGSGTITGTLSGAAVLAPLAGPNPGFLVALNAPASVQAASLAGVAGCGGPFAFPSGQGTFSLQYCDGAAPAYELDVNAADVFAGSFIDLGGASGSSISGTGNTSFGIDHASGIWSLSPLAAAFDPANVINSASGAPGIAPGGLVSILGTGFALPGTQPVVAFNGEYAPVLTLTPFRIDVQVPADIPPGQTTIDVVTPQAGTAEQTVTVSPVAPAIQLIAPRQGRITNQDGAANNRYQPASRGQQLTIFGTGFGSLGVNNVLATPVHAFIAGTEVPVNATALVPNSTGLYRITITLPASLAPGLSLELKLVQGDVTSNAVDVAIQ